MELTSYDTQRTGQDKARPRAMSNGERRTHDEVGLYTVKNDVITREEFFYVGPFI